jgi:hypothetical protein
MKVFLESSGETVLKRYVNLLFNDLHRKSRVQDADEDMEMILKEEYRFQSLMMIHVFIPISSG